MHGFKRVLITSSKKLMKKIMHLNIFDGFGGHPAARVSHIIMYVNPLQRNFALNTSQAGVKNVR